MDHLQASSFSIDQNKYSSQEDYLNALITKFVANYNSALELYVPKTTKGGTRKKEWYDAACYEATKATNVAYHRWQASKSSTDHEKYNLSLANRIWPSSMQRRTTKLASA